MLSIIVPAYNEGKRISATLKELTGFLEGQEEEYEVVVVADGDDDTPEKCKGFKRVRVLEFKHRLGKGGGVIKGIKAVHGNVLLLYDADAATPAKEIPRLLKALESSDFAIGCRYCRGARVETSFHRRLAGKTFNLLARFLFWLPFKDTQCGFKAFHARKIKALVPEFTEKGFVWDVELLWLAKRHGFSVAEVPIEWHHVEGGTAEAGGALQIFKTAFRMFKALVSLRIRTLG